MDIDEVLRLCVAVLIIGTTFCSGILYLAYLCSSISALFMLLIPVLTVVLILISYTCVRFLA